MKKITRKVRGMKPSSWRDEKKEAMRLKELIGQIAFELGIDEGSDVDVWLSELADMEELKSELQELNFNNRDLVDERDSLKEENKKLSSQLEGLMKAFDEVRALNIPQASKNKKTKI